MSSAAPRGSGGRGVDERDGLDCAPALMLLGRLLGTSFDVPMEEFDFKEVMDFVGEIDSAGEKYLGAEDEC